MLAAGAGVPAQQEQVEQDKAIRTGVTASVDRASVASGADGDLSEVHPLGSAAEPIAVDIVTPAGSRNCDAGRSRGRKSPSRRSPQPDKPEPQLTLPDPSALTQKASLRRKPPRYPPRRSRPARPQPAAKAQTGRSPTGHARCSCPPAPAAPPAPPPPAGSASPGYRPAEPDLSVKYNVMLGLPMDAPPPAKRREVRGGF